MSIHQYKKAFTVIEMLIVITIIAIVAVMGTSAYSLSRRAITIDLQAGSLVANLQSLREEAKRGSVCIGMRFEEKKTPLKISAPYLNRARGCGEEVSAEDIRWPNDIGFSQFLINGKKSKKIDVLFAPPGGNMLLTDNAEQGHIWLMLLSSPNRNESIVELNSRSGIIQKIKKSAK